MNVAFRLEKETKGAVRYAEDGDRENHKISTLYIRKSAFEDGEPFPQRLMVTVKAA